MQFLSSFNCYFLLFMGLINLFSRPAFSNTNDDKKEFLIGVGKNYIKKQSEIYEKYFLPFHEEITKAKSNDLENQCIEALIEDFFGISFSTINDITQITISNKKEEIKKSRRNHIRQIFIQDHFWSILQGFIEGETEIKKQQGDNYKYREQAFIEIFIEEIALYMMMNYALIEKTFHDIFSIVNNAFIEIFGENVPNHISRVISRNIKAIFLKKDKSINLFSESISILEESIQILCSSEKLMNLKISKEEFLKLDLVEKIKKSFPYRQEKMPKVTEKELISSIFPEEELKKLAITLGIKEKFENLHTLEEKLELLAMESFIQKSIEKNIQALFSEIQKIEKLGMQSEAPELLEKKAKKLFDEKLLVIPSQEKFTSLMFPEEELKKLAITLGIKEKFENLSSLDKKLKLLATALSLQDRIEENIQVLFSEEKIKALFPNLSEEEILQLSLEAKVKKLSLFKMPKATFFIEGEIEGKELISLMFPEEKLQKLAIILGIKEKFEKLTSSDKKLELLATALSLQEEIFTSTKKMKLLALSLNQESLSSEKESLFSEKELSLFSSEEKEIVKSTHSFFKQKIEELSLEGKLCLIHFLIQEALPHTIFADYNMLKELQEFSSNQEKESVFSEDYNKNNKSKKKKIKKQQKKQEEKSEYYENVLFASLYLERVPFNEFYKDFGSKKPLQISPSFEIPMFLRNFSEALRHILKEIPEESKSNKIGSNLIEYIKDLVLSLTKEGCTKKFITLVELKKCFSCLNTLKKVHQINNINTDFWKNSFWSHSLLYRENNFNSIKGSFVDSLYKKAEKKNNFHELKKDFNKESVNHFIKKLKESVIVRGKKIKTEKKNNEPVKEKEEVLQENNENSSQKIHKSEFSGISSNAQKRMAKRQKRAEENQQEFETFFRPESEETLQKNNENSSQPQVFFIAQDLYKIFTQMKKKAMKETGDLNIKTKDFKKLVKALGGEVNHNEIKIPCFDENGNRTKELQPYRLDFPHGRELERFHHGLRHHSIRHFTNANLHYAHVYSKKDAPKEDTLTY